MRHFLDFEKPIAELEGKIEELRRTTDAGGIDVADEVGKLRDKAQALLKTTYAKLTPWQKALVARHPDRPHATDYIDALIEDFTPLAGDRAFADDLAVVGGMGRFRGRAVMVLGTERGNDTDSRVKHNFGMARPEGYRKARRLMDLAGRFGLPILSFVDTAGAFPGIDAEARGQAEAIARSIEAGLEAPVPFIASIIGEGGSGGAIARGGDLDQFEGVGRDADDLAGCPRPMCGSACPLHQPCDALDRAELHDALDRGEVDAQIERAGGDDELHVA